MHSVQMSTTVSSTLEKPETSSLFFSPLSSPNSSFVPHQDPFPGPICMRYSGGKGEKKRWEQAERGKGRKSSLVFLLSCRGQCSLGKMVPLWQWRLEEKRGGGPSARREARLNKEAIERRSMNFIFVPFPGRLCLRPLF